FTVSDRTFNRAIGGEPKEVRKRRILLWIDGRCKFHGHRYTFIVEYRGLSQLTKLVAILIQVFDEVEILRNAANDRLQYRQASRLQHRRSPCAQTLRCNLAGSHCVALRRRGRIPAVLVHARANSTIIPPHQWHQPDLQQSTSRRWADYQPETVRCGASESSCLPTRDRQCHHRRPSPWLRPIPNG